MKSKIIIGAVIVLLIGAFVYYRFQEAKMRQFFVAFLDIGQGDSALINFGSGEQMLVDCGPDRSVLFALGRQVPLYDRTIDYLLVTHPDRDHYGGCAGVLQRYRVKNIILNGRRKPADSYWREFNEAVEAEAASNRILNGFSRVQMSSSTLEFFAPDDTLEIPAGESDSNNSSIVFKLTTPDRSRFLFTGDMEEPLEQALLKKYCPATSPCPALAADILKVGHHGSDSSTSEKFLKAVQARAAIISVGQDNRYGHPSRRVLRRLERAGAAILRTDTLGDIVQK